MTGTTGGWREIPVGAWPDGNTLSVAAWRVRGERPGPAVLITAGIHGDEFGSVAAARDLIGWLETAPVAGEVQVVPALNPPALMAGTRQVPPAFGEGDLNACFPGDPAGSPASRLAAAVWQSLVAGADLVIDLHTASAGTASVLLWYLNAASPEAEAERRLAGATPVRLALSLPLPGSLVAAAGQAGKPALILEVGEGGRLDDSAIAGAVAAVQALLTHLWEQAPPRDPVVPLGGFVPVPAPAAGLLRMRVVTGDQVRAGDTLAVICPLHRREIPVPAPRDGLVLGVATAPWREEGARVAVLGWAAGAGGQG